MTIVVTFDKSLSCMVTPPYFREGIYKSIKNKGYFSKKTRTAEVAIPVYAP